MDCFDFHKVEMKNESDQTPVRVTALVEQPLPRNCSITSYSLKAHSGMARLCHEDSGVRNAVPHSDPERLLSHRSRLYSPDASLMDLLAGCFRTERPCPATEADS